MMLKNYSDDIDARIIVQSADRLIAELNKPNHDTPNN